ncbi:DMT family transporter [Rheinheimera sp.]|uniref:DMT family transporter n=1 Tax=Rheinheimera sp. TaxID=1869214 RepID=UPI00307ECAC1
MPVWKVVGLTCLALLAFAGNSLLCRAALLNGTIDPASFTSLRLLSGTVTLALLVALRTGLAPLRARGTLSGSWLSALSLFVYAAGFSFSYLQLTTATGALILFGAVQISMIGYGFYRGERFSLLQWAGLLLAGAGLLALLLPGASAPPLLAAVLMLGAGVAWALYSIRGKGAGDPLHHTAGNFIRTLPLCLLLSLWYWQAQSFEAVGVVYALVSGAVTSGLGYALWYAVLPLLKATTAATVQLSVPVIAAFAAVLFLQEAISLRLALASCAVLGGVGLVLRSKT